MLFSAPTDAGSLYISSCSFLTFALQKMGCNQLLKLARKCSFVWYLLIEIVVFFSFTGSSIPFLGRRRQSLTDCHFRIWTQRVTFETLDPSDIWSEWCQYKKTKRQKDKKTKGQKDQRTKRQKDKKRKRQKGKNTKESVIFWYQGSFTLLRCFLDETKNFISCSFTSGCLVSNQLFPSKLRVVLCHHFYAVHTCAQQIAINA